MHSWLGACPYCSATFSSLVSWGCCPVQPLLRTPTLPTQISKTCNGSWLGANPQHKLHKLVPSMKASLWVRFLKTLFRYSTALLITSFLFWVVTFGCSPGWESDNKVWEKKLRVVALLSISHSWFLFPHFLITFPGRWTNCQMAPLSLHSFGCKKRWLIWLFGWLGSEQ